MSIENSVPNDESRNDYASIIAFSARDAVIMLDELGKVVFWNPAAERIFGYSPDEMAGKELVQFVIPERYKEAHSKGYERFTQTKGSGFISKTLELAGLRKSGEEFPIELSLSSYKKGDSWHAVGIIRNITERKKAELELYQAKVNAEEATKVKEKFVSLVAHDLRSPFASILGMIELLLRDNVNPLPPKQRELLERAKRSGKHLVGMIEQLLDIHRLKTGNINLKKRFHDLRFIIHNFSETLSYLAENKGITLINDVPQNTRVYADFNLLGEVIQNLVSNAIKFCNSGDTVRIYANREENITLAVEDNGDGIDEEFLPNLFKKEIKTTKKGSAGEPGTGLGLPFCYDIMSSLGGNLRVESNKGEGSVFFAELPAVVPKILIVEEEAEELLNIERILRDEGYETETARSPREALEILEDNQPHLLLIQFDKPKVENLQTLKMVRRFPNNPDIPIIAMISDSEVEISRAFTPMYINSSILKPINGENLLPPIQKYLMKNS